jgi:ABC-2 type transport system ATP-binding protein
VTNVKTNPDETSPNRHLVAAPRPHQERLCQRYDSGSTTPAPILLLDQEVDRAATRCEGMSTPKDPTMTMDQNPEPESAVAVVGLTKRFGETEALRGIDFSIPPSRVLGLLGPNGAGKTTAVRILTTLLQPDAGRAFVDGIDVVREPARARARIGLTGQYAAVDERLTGAENLEHVGRLFHLAAREARRRGQELLESFGLEDAAGRVVRGYSGGMRRRLDIAMSLIGRPSVLFLDEPTTGLDPRSRLGMWDVIEELARSGTTTLLTTQYLEEADRLADEIVVIDHGMVIARGTAGELKRRVSGDRVEVTMTDPGDLRRAVEVLAPIGSDAAVADSASSSVSVPVHSSDGIVPVVVRMLDSAALAVRDVAVRRATLDDVFLTLTGRTSDDGEPEEQPDREQEDAA